MVENEFDQACRYAAKLDPVGLIAWLLRLALDAFLFRGWLDTRTIAFPGEPDRICDTVAHLEDIAAGQIPWAVPLEFELEPNADMFGRLQVYGGRVWLECRPDPEPRSRFQVGAILVNLTGRGTSSRRFIWKAAGLRTELRIVERNLAKESAVSVLHGIETGKWSRCVLPWIPLMKGGGKPDIIQKWMELALAEPDARRRAEYAGLALVFAEAAKRKPLWKEALKEWNMILSETVQEWKAEARAEALVELLGNRFGHLPEELASVISSTKDVPTLKAWSAEAAKAASLETFRQATKI